MNRMVRLSPLAIAVLLATLPPTSAAAPAPEPVGPPKPVIVVNNPDQPVPVTGSITGEVTIANPVQVSQASRVPFHKFVEASLFDGDDVKFVDIFTVPVGKQLVVTHVTGAVAPPGGGTAGFRINVQLGDSFVAIFDLPMVASGQLTSTGPNARVTSEPMDLIVEEGLKLTCSIIRSDSDGNAQGRCGATGYLVDVP